MTKTQDVQDVKDIKSLGAQVRDDVVTLAKDAGALIAEVCERIYAPIKAALAKRKSAQPAAE